MTVTPFWLSYAIVLLGLYIWAARLIEPTQRDNDTSDREENGAA